MVGENQTLAIVTPESIVVVDQASGQVFQAPNTPPGSSSNVRTPSQSGIHGCLVTFRPSATQRLGFDAVGNGVVKPNSYFLRDRNGDAVPWKSLEAGNTDYVAMLTNGDCQADSLRFIRESGLLTPTTPGRNNSLELLLTGGFQGQEERLTVARATTNHINDSTSEEILTEAGVLGLVSYQRITRDVFLIPVNGASFPTASTQLSDIEKRLNEIYGSAVINWNVHFDEPIEVGRINEADFKVEGTSMLSKYTSDMNRVIRTYKRNRPSDDNSLYLFFVELSDLGTSRKGFMPLAGNFGFIFNFSASDFDLLAHELAHGAFNLRHTFSDKAQHYFPVQQTANLMDYAGGTDLWKYQWDLIHNPESILFSWAQDEEEGAMISADWTFIVERIRCARYNGDASIDISSLAAQMRQSTLTWNYPHLLDNKSYGNIVLTMDYAELKTIDVNKITVQDDKISIGEKWEQIHFQIINCHRNNPSVVEEAHQLFNYLVVDKSEYELEIKNLCKRMDEMNDIGVQIKRLPSCFFKTLSLERRADYIEKLAKDCEINHLYILQIINTIPERGQYVLDLFSMLNSKPNISRALFDKSLWSNTDRYKNLIETFTHLFYRNVVKEEVKDQVGRNYLFKWHRDPKSFNIYYSAVLDANNDIKFDADLEYYVDNKNNREVVEYERGVVMPIFDVVGVDFQTKVDFIGDEVEIFPMPAFYFNWMNQEYNRIQRNQAINVTIYALSFTLGVGEIAAAKKAWDIAVGLTGLVHSSGGLYFKINDDVVKRLEKTDNGLRFIIAWDAIGYVLTGLEMRSELLKVRLPYFSAVVHAWEHLSHEEKLVLKEMMGEDEYDQLIAIINTSK